MKTEIILVTDRSGSMEKIDEAACAGINSFMEEQQGVPGEARVTTVFFDDLYEVRQQGLPIERWMTLHTVGPRNMTALRDAIGETIMRQGDRIAKEGWADLVICVVTTDGLENKSRKYSQAQVKELVEQAQARGWQFIFLAANQDAVVTGAQYGFKAETSYTFQADAAGTQAGYSTASTTTRSMRGTSL